MFSGLHEPLLNVLPPAAPTAALLAGLGLGMGGLAWSVFAPSSQVFGPVVRQLADPGAVALTFDDGPTVPFTAQILAVLATRRVEASFFVVGRWVREHPDLVRRIVGEGHVVGNHTWDHHHFGVIEGFEYWRQQIERTNEAIHEATGSVPQLFRPPMGFKTWHLAAAARGAHMRIVGWSVRGRDTGAVISARIVVRVVRRLQGGAIVGLHDGLEPARVARSQARTVEALPAILDAIAQRGLRCVSLRALQEAPLLAHARDSGP